MGHFGLKTRSNLFKNPVYTFSPIIMKVCQNVCLHEILDKIETMSKTRSLRQTLEKPCVSSREQILGLILMKFVHSFCLDETWYIFENVSYWVRN